MNKALLLFSFMGLFWHCQTKSSPVTQQTTPSDSPYIIVLGIAQDAGYPQAQCKKECCAPAWADPAKRKMTSCIALVDPQAGHYYLVDATPNIKDQMKMAENISGCKLNGILLTHAHIGHYTGLMHLGREVMGAKNIPVFVMPRMFDFLSQNGPWDQLVKLKNIELRSMKADSMMCIDSSLWISPHLVPHRDEYSETVGFMISGNSKTGWFIPDIDKWHLWESDIKQELGEDFLFVDGTFYANGEIPGRNMSDIPHPFIEETMDLLKDEREEDKAKVHFIHFNHTNPAIWSDSVRKKIIEAGFGLAHEGQIMAL